MVTSSSQTINKPKQSAITNSCRAAGWNAWTKWYVEVVHQEKADAHVKTFQQLFIDGISIHKHNK